MGGRGSGSGGGGGPSVAQANKAFARQQAATAKAIQKEGADARRATGQPGDSGGKVDKATQDRIRTGYQAARTGSPTREIADRRRGEKAQYRSYSKSGQMSVRVHKRPGATP